jgi:hypothetical protein
MGFYGEMKQNDCHSLQLSIRGSPIKIEAQNLLL